MPRTQILRYGAGNSQFLELTLPTTPGHHPVVLLVHGGFWRAAHHLDLMRPMARALVPLGYAVANLEYRRVGEPGGGWPGTFVDVGDAVDLLASVPRLDLDRVSTVGHSAGGHLALWIAARSRLPLEMPGSWPAVSPRLAVSLAGVNDLDVAAGMHLGAGATQALMGGGPAEVDDERYALASPAALLPLGVRTVLITGDRDTAVPHEVSVRYAEAAREAGDDVTLHVVPGADHMSMIDVAGPPWQLVLEALRG